MRKQKCKRYSVTPHWLVPTSRRQNVQDVVVERSKGWYGMRDTIHDKIKGERGMPQSLK